MRYRSRWKKIIRDVSLATPNLQPMIARFLHSEKCRSRVNSLEGLAHWELESLSVFFLMDLVRISCECYGLLGRELAGQLGCQELSHAELKLCVGKELLSIFAFLKMLSAAQVIKGRADKFELTDRSLSKIVLKELVMHHRSEMTLFVPVCGLCLGD